MTGSAQIVAILSRAFTWKYNSLAGYVLQAEPYVRENEAKLLALVAQIAKEDKAFAVELARSIERHDAAPARHFIAAKRIRSRCDRFIGHLELPPSAFASTISFSNLISSSK